MESLTSSYLAAVARSFLGRTQALTIPRHARAAREQTAIRGFDLARLHCAFFRLCPPVRCLPRSCFRSLLVCSLRREPVTALPNRSASVDSDCLCSFWYLFALFLFSVYLSFRFGHSRHRAPPAMGFRAVGGPEAGGPGINRRDRFFPFR